MGKNFLITTGGSGGHVLPAKIIFEHLSKDKNVIISIDRRGLKYLEKDNYQFEIIDTPKLNNIFILPVNLIKILFLTLKSILLLKRKKIDQILSTGGYMSLPIILAARLLQLNIYLLEPNQVLGRANRYFLGSCKKIFCYSEKIKNFPDDSKDKIITINPLVAENIYKLKKSEKMKDEFTLLIVGGSQGASIFDRSLKSTIVNISKKITIKIIQQTSQKNINSLSDYYSKNNVENKIFSFDKDFTQFIQEADLCITRAGASTLAELSVMNTPFIAVPLPTSKDNHQMENANFYKDNNSCWIIEQINFEEKIEQFLIDVLNNKSDYLNKKENLKKLNFQNTWINVNQKILRAINEN
jgi:UDP-N-acetylglucosamine--N-acetylmuramyl-(pentapeptide) pyrophosphoryl-undecaprenol N-acetylglucosamine transferase